MSSYIPIEIVSKILRKLDIQTIVRCRCVSPEWRSLIDSHDFIYIHMDHSIKTNTNNTIIFLHQMGSLYSVNFDTLYPGNPINLQGQPIIPPQRHGVRFIGSCNGLLCLCNAGEDFLIINPLLQKYKQILSTLTLVSDEDSNFERGYGFGYDAVSKDYKLVKILQGPGLSYGESEMGIYSLMNDLYEIIPMPYDLLTNHSYGVYVGGALYWFVGKDPDAIVGFDLGVHEFREVAQPDYGGNVDDRELCVLDGCLCVVVKFRGVGCDVWVMKEYGVKESWRNVFSVSCSEFHHSVKPLGYSRKSGEVLLEVDWGKSFVWYDIEKKRALDVVIEGRLDYFTATLCLSSLVPLKQGQPLEKRKVPVWKNWKRGFELES